jgi:hypothetical protein
MQSNPCFRCFLPASGADGQNPVMLFFPEYNWFAMNLEAGGIGNFLSFLGMLVLSLTGVNDILHHMGVHLINSVTGLSFTAPIGMTFFVSCNAIVVSMEYVDTETALMNERRQSETLATENAALESTNRLEQRKKRL